MKKLLLNIPWIRQLYFIAQSVTMGDLADRYTIECIKGIKIKDYPQSNILYIEQAYESKLETINDTIYEAIEEWRYQLLQINEYQWELEDRVRLQQDWKSCYAARVNNSERIRIKNEINKLYGDMLEIKEYQEKD